MFFFCLLNESWFNIFGDMEEFEQMFAPQKVGQDWRVNKIGRRHMIGSCSALIKVLPETSDIFTSHVTWNGFESMIRILKKYNFEYRQTASSDSPLVSGHSMSFSSYPGLLYSGDDFTVISSGLVSMETTIGNNSKHYFLRLTYSNEVLSNLLVCLPDLELFKYIKPTGQVLEGVRSMVANRLASNGMYSHFVFLSVEGNNLMLFLVMKAKNGQTFLDVTTAERTTING